MGEVIFAEGALATNKHSKCHILTQDWIRGTQAPSTWPQMVGMLDGRPPGGNMKRQDIKLEKDQVWQMKQRSR